MADTPKKRTKPLFPPTDYENFAPTEQVASREHLTAQLGGGDNNAFFRHLSTASAEDTRWRTFDPATGYFGAFASGLKTHGVRRMAKEVLAGSFAGVFEASNRQMLRAVNEKGGEEETSNWPGVLKPLKTLHISGCRVDVLPRVHSLHEIVHDDELAAYYGLPNREKDADTIIRKLVVENWRAGRFLWDPDLENIGLIKHTDGRNVPVIMDLEAVKSRRLATEDDYGWFIPEDYDTSRRKHISTEDSWEKIAKSYLRYLCRKYPKEPPLPYAEAQAAHVESLGLEYGKIKGALDEDTLHAVCAALIREHNADIEAYNASLNGSGGAPQRLYSEAAPPLYVEALQECSGGEFKSAIRAAVEQHVEGEGLCHQVRAQLTKRGIIRER